MPEVNGIKVPFIPITGNETIVKKKLPEVKNSFESLLQTELEKIKFSNHAQKRLESRNIQLTDTDIDKIQSAVQKAELKGAKDSLVLLNNTAFIVNIPNKTVVTTMPVNSTEENIFTNIDSVVFT